MSPKNSVYILKGNHEFERLEHQSSLDMTSPQRDLKDIHLTEDQKFLDAGCGSGLSSRYLATTFRNAQGIGCDASDLILAKAKQAAQNTINLTFEKQDIRDLSYPPHSFDLIICRYVLHHLSPKDRLDFVKSAKKCLKPGGLIRLIDIDGIFFNVFPISKFLAKAFRLLETKGTIDLQVGRKLAHLLHQGEFRNVDWRIDTLEFKNEFAQVEKKMAAERIDSAIDYYSKTLGGKRNALRFRDQFCAALDIPGGVCFYNKFIVTGVKGT